MSSVAYRNVDMANATYPTYRDDLAISVVDKDGTVMHNPIVQTKLAMDKIEVTPLKEGSCFIRIHHDSATYDLDVRCRVTTETDTAHIELSAKDVTVTTTDSQTVTAHIEGLPNDTTVDPNKYEWTFSDSASGLIDYAISGGGETGRGDSIFITGKGKRSGAVKVTVTHPQAGLPKSFIVFVKNATGEAASTRTYISTSQDYIELYEGGDNCKIELSLHNLESGTVATQLLCSGAGNKVKMTSTGIS